MASQINPAPIPEPTSDPAAAPVTGGRVQYSPSDLLAVLNELASILEDAKPVMLSKDIRVNREVALGLINELRGALPVAVEQADEALTRARLQLDAATKQADSLDAASRAEAEATLVNARAEADNIVASARQQQKEMVEREAIVVQAKTRAQEIIAQAATEAEQLMVDADAYCDSSLARFGNDLAVLQNQVAAGRAQLAGRHPQLAQVAGGQPGAAAPPGSPQPARAGVAPGQASRGQVNRQHSPNAGIPSQAAAGARRP